MAYTRFDTTKPAGSQTGSAFATSANANDDALFDMVGMSLMDGFNYSQSGGTAEEPTTILFTSGTRILQAALTWASGNITAATFSLSLDTGTTYSTIGSAAAFTYDGSGNLTASTNFGGLFLKVMEVLGKYKATRTAYNAHAAATGTAVHGLGTMSTQAATAVAITGGNIDGTVIGATTRAIGTFKQARGVHVSAAFGATTTLDWSAGDSFDFTSTGSGAATLAFSNLPATGLSGWITVDMTNGGLRTWTWPTGTKWVGGAAPTLSSAGRDRLNFFTRDGGTTIDGFVGKGMA